MDGATVAFVSVLASWMLWNIAFAARDRHSGNDAFVFFCQLSVMTASLGTLATAATIYAVPLFSVDS